MDRYFRPFTSELRLFDIELRCICQDSFLKEKMVGVLWFRHGLRLHDNNSLHEAIGYIKPSCTIKKTYKLRNKFKNFAFYLPTF